VKWTNATDRQHIRNKPKHERGGGWGTSEQTARSCRRRGRHNPSSLLRSAKLAFGRSGRGQGGSRERGRERDSGQESITVGRMEKKGDRKNQNGNNNEDGRRAQQYERMWGEGEEGHSEIGTCREGRGREAVNVPSGLGVPVLRESGGCAASRQRPRYCGRSSRGCARSGGPALETRVGESGSGDKDTPISARADGQPPSRF